MPINDKKRYVNTNLYKRAAMFFVAAFMAFTLLGVISCTSSTPQELAASEKLWKDQGLKNYDFTLTRQCFCPEDWRGPVNIQVRNGEATSVTYVSSGAVVTEGKFNNADTIDKLFTILKNAYAGNGDFDQKADTINVTYDANMGYPRDFFIDVSQTIADEEQGYTITNFVAK
jgi:major membrane immunogen (membrane-anchored lipoprotein)